METTTLERQDDPSEVEEPSPTLWDRGASLVEYALLLALIAVVCVGAVTFFGEATSSSYDESTQSMFSD